MLGTEESEVNESAQCLRADGRPLWIPAFNFSPFPWIGEALDRGQASGKLRKATFRAASDARMAGSAVDTARRAGYPWPEKLRGATRSCGCSCYDWPTTR